MNLLEILHPECIAVSKELKDKPAAMREITRLIKDYHGFDTVSEEKIAKGLEEREKLGSTGFGKGIAIPHCRLKEAPEFIVGIITVPKGVDFDALDGEKVHLIVFMVGPEQETTEHIRLLSLISRTLSSPGMVDEILSQTTPDSVYESFVRCSGDHVSTKDRKEKQICYVFVQDEELFRDILQIFAAMETTSLSVIEAKNTREYLSKMPLFTEFWSDSHLGFNRVIVAIIDKTLTNETLRAIEDLTGNLDQRTDIMVTVQDIFYTAGSLEA